ncbi:AsmA family protein [Geoalkalibacter sp.]|uniref:AsmA family protein n=1 Tax=Geoalkalibacter sp. TaxID=3041440 RepID=UPI00272EB7E3|nr:AsmA family protein [Geoalkalibacter sp.]
MNRFVKVGAIVGGALLVLVVALAILAKVLITPERVRATVEPLAEKALGREVRLGAIDVSFLSGITLRDLAVQEKVGEELFVSADQVILRYQFWPLLFLQVVVDEVRLEQPRIRVVRLADGSFNFSDLLKGTGDAAEGVAPVPPDTAATAPPIHLTVAKVRLVGGELLFIDQRINPQAPLRYQISRLDVSADDISLQKAFPFELACRVNEAPLSLTGQVDPHRQGGQVRVNLKDFDPVAFLPYFREQIPGRLGGLKVDIDAQAEGSMEQMTSKGKIALRDLNLTLDALTDAPIRGANLSLDYDLHADLQASALRLNGSRLDFNGIVAETSGRVENYATQPALALDVRVPSLDLRKALAALPQELVKDATAFDPAGAVELTARLEGPVDKGAALLQGAEVRMQAVEANVGHLRPALNGLLKLQGDQLASQDLTVRAGDNRAQVDLKASNLFGKPIKATTHVVSERFDLDALLATGAAPAAAGMPGSAAPQKAAEEIGPFDIPLTAEGTVKIAQALYKGMNVSDFDLAYRLINNVLTVDKMTGRVVGGTFNQTARIDLGRKGLDYQSKINLQALQADPFVTAFWPKAAGTLFGNLNLDLDISGRGTLADSIKQNLTGRGTLNLADGRVTGAGLAQGLADFLNLEDLRVLRFSHLRGTLTLDQGRMRLDSEFSGNEVRMKPQGIVGLDGSLDLALNARLAPALMQKLDQRGRVARFLTDPDGWGQLPLKVTGNYDQPRFAMDTAGVRQQVEEQAVERAREELQKRVIDRIAPPQPEGQPEGEPDPKRQLLDDAVRGLFRR